MKKILIIDDDEGIVEFLTLCLKTEGYHVESAPNGRIGVIKAKKIKPDLVVLDLLMPEMHGWDVCEELKNDETLKSVKVIISTAKGYEVDRRAAEKLGADRFIVKPFSPEAITAVVKELLFGADGG